MSILSFPLKKKTTKSSLTVLFRLGDEKKDEPTTWGLKSAMTFCKQDSSLRRKPSAINEMVSFL